MTQYIDMTPTWEGLLPALLAVYENASTVAGRKIAQEELTKMAKAADLAVAMTKKEKTNAS